MLQKLFSRFGRTKINSTKIIKTKRLLLEPFSDKYLTQEVVDWLNDPEVVRFSEQRHRRHSLDSCREYIDSFKGTANHLWAISVVNKNIGHIGNINAYVDTANNIADIGILIGKKQVWSKGYGKEALCAVCDYLMEKLGIRKITCGTLATNLSMLKVMKKAGMIDDGRRIRHYQWEGHEVDMIHQAMFKKE